MTLAEIQKLRELEKAQRDMYTSEVVLLTSELNALLDAAEENARLREALRCVDEIENLVSPDDNNSGIEYFLHSMKANETMSGNEVTLIHGNLRNLAAKIFAIIKEHAKKLDALTEATTKEPSI